jgi:Domain of unknown function (DUF4178)
VSAANCPSCGAPVEFRIGSSAVVVCQFCSTLVARTDRGVEDHGKVAALVDTGSPLQVGLYGRYRGKQFRLTGRTQMRHQAGGVWDEWYAAFDDGRWGWLAEAQGRYYVTFEVAAAAPPFERLRLGERVEDLTVTEIGRAVLISAEGEIPWKPAPGYEYDYADLSGTEGRFATIDYSEEPPKVFKGTETNLAELGIKAEAARTTKVSVAKLSCSNCGGPLELRAPDRSERIYCPNCGSGHDIAEGKLTFFKTKMKQRVEPVIPLGSTGTIDGDSYVVAGFMERAVHFDQDYFWTEYLLFNANKGFRWLVHSDDHWSFVTPLNPGEVDGGTPGLPPKKIHWQGKTFSLFQTAEARVTYVVGEFYWKVAVGERVATADYIKPPEGLSQEVTKKGAQEISWSHARYMTPAAVESAFNVSDLPRPTTVGPMQPYEGGRLGRMWLIFAGLLILAAIAISIMLPNRELANLTFELVPPSNSTDSARTFVVEPLQLSGENNVVVEASSVLSNSWVYVAGDLVDTSTGMLDSFDMPLEYYSGVDGGERWSEGSRRRRKYLPAPARKGTYALRLDVQWEPGKTPPPLSVKVREGVFRWPHFWLAFVALALFPILGLIRRISFESKRWKDSAFSPFGTATSEDEEEDE